MFDKIKILLLFLFIALISIVIVGFLAKFYFGDVKFNDELTPEDTVPKNINKTLEGVETERQNKTQVPVQFFHIDTSNGLIKGEERKYKYVANETYYAFQGIPYAKPPIGKLRFKDPVPPTPWENVLDTTSEKNICPQKAIPGLSPSMVIGSEDCLYLNVYTPHKPDKIKKLKPVMIWFHGGGFESGSGNSDDYGPDFLVRNDVILVTFNYRLGALGFLNLNIASVPGNAGLKDQVMVLKWVNSNISLFGGDPNNVTLFGADAGAASIQMLTQSSDIKSQGLFHKLILHSGSVMNPWAFTDENEENACELAEALGISTLSNDYKAIADELRAKPVYDIINAQDRIVTKKDLERLKVFAFVPSIEETSGNKSLIICNPYLLFASGHLDAVPTIAGISNSEANIAFLYYPELITPQFMESLNELPDELIPSLVEEVDDKVVKSVAKNMIRKFFFKDVYITWENIPEFMKMLSDGLVSLGAYMTIEILKSMHSPLYVYEFSFEGELNYVGNTAKQIFKAINEDIKANHSSNVINPSNNINNDKIDFDKIKISGASHMDDLGYLFLVNKFDKKISEDSHEYKVREQLCLMWTNFAKTSNPNSDNVIVNWPKYSDLNTAYLDIGTKFDIKHEELQKSRYKFWKTLFIAIFQNNPAVILNYFEENPLS